jgi:hypothetical protein
VPANVGLRAVPSSKGFGDLVPIDELFNIGLTLAFQVSGDHFFPPVYQLLNAE